MRGGMILIAVIILVGCDQAPLDDGSAPTDEITRSELHGTWHCDTRLVSGKNSRDKMYFGSDGEYILSTPDNSFSGTYVAPEGSANVAVHISEIQGIGSTSKNLQGTIVTLNMQSLTFNLSMGNKAPRIMNCEAEQ